MASTEVKKPKKPKWETIYADFESIPISSRYSVEIGSSPSFEGLADEKKRLVEVIWEQEQKRKGGRLFNGMILSAVEFNEKKLRGQFVPYKYFLAQTCDPSLKPDLKILPVSLSGLTMTDTSFILAKRASWVTQYPDLYELAPSGGVTELPFQETTIDLKGQLLEGLQEEVGIDRSLVKKVKFFALIRDHQADAVELIADIEAKPFSLQSSTGEYAQIMNVPIKELEAFVNLHRLEFVPLSLAILKLRKLIS